jgi:hypothetical protein
LSVFAYNMVHNIINPNNPINNSVNKLVNNANTKSYSAYNVSFNYPAKWTVMTTSIGGTDIITVSMINLTNNNQDSSPQLQVSILPLPFGLSDQEALKSMENSRSDGWKRISNNTLTVDNNKAYEDIFIVNDTSNFPEIMKVQQIAFAKNGKMYTLVFQAPEKSFDNEKSNFDTMLNSIQIQ